MPTVAADERELIGFLDRIDDEITAHRKAKKFEDRVEQWSAFRGGEAWRGQGEEPIFTANLLGNLIERKIALLTQSQPVVRVSARDARLGPSADVLTRTAEAILSEWGFGTVVERAADFASTIGYVGFNLAWDPYADYGAGDIVCRVLDPRRFAVDHHVTDVTRVHQDAQYLRISRPMPLADVRRVWPGRGADVVADPELSEFSTEARGGGGISFGSPTKRPLNAPITATGPYAWTTVHEYWVRSDQLQGDGTPLFPAGRVIHRAGDVILDDEPNPYWDGAWPIEVWDWRVDAASLQGRSDVAEAVKLQESLNRLGHSTLKNVLLSNVISIVGDYNALSPQDWEKLDNRAARVIKKNPGRDLAIVPPPPIPDQYLRLMDILASMMETVIGVPKAMQGERQAGVIAAAAVEGLMTAGETLVRSVARRLESVVERLGRLLVSRIIQFYTSDRVFSLVGPGQEWQEYTFVRQELLGTWFDTVPDAERDRKLREFFTNFRFKVTPLSSLPQNRSQRGMMAAQLAQMGLVDGEEVLKMTEWPDWRAVMTRVQQKQATGQMPPPPAPEPPRANRRGTAYRPG